MRVKADNFDKLAEYLTPEQIDEMTKAVEEVRRMNKQQRQMNEYYGEWKKQYKRCFELQLIVRRGNRNYLFRIMQLFFKILIVWVIGIGIYLNEDMFGNGC